jgi:hypothetical protein
VPTGISQGEGRQRPRGASAQDAAMEQRGGHRAGEKQGPDQQKAAAVSRHGSGVRTGSWPDLSRCRADHG